MVEKQKVVRCATVALKFLAAPLLDDAEAKERYLREGASPAASGPRIQIPSGSNV